MRKTIMAVALGGIAISIAIAVRSELKQDEAEPADAAAPALADTSAAAVAPVIVDTTPPVVEPHTMPVKPVGTVAPPPASEQTTTGADVLRRASAAYSAIKSLQASFTQKRENPLLGSSLTSRGTLYQKRPDRFLLKFSQPAGDVIMSDGRHFWIYYPSVDKRQVIRAPASQNGAGGVDLQAQFMGDPLRRFTHTYHGKETTAGRTAHVLTLVPRESLGYRTLKVWVDDEDALVRRFILTEDNGVVQDFTLSKLSINPELSNDLFRFTPPPDAHIIER